MSPNSLIRFDCPCGCGKPLLSRPDRTGTQTRCRNTGSRVRVPVSGEAFGRKQWDACTHPGLLRSALVLVGMNSVDARRCRLHVVAVTRRAFDTCHNHLFRSALSVGERYADGEPMPEAAELVGKIHPGLHYFQDVSWQAAAMFCLTEPLSLDAHPIPTLDHEFPAESAVAYHDIFPNPFRPPRVLAAWRTSTALDLAAGIYAEKAFDRLPVLADALEDVGCDELPLLHHLRGDGPHFRGCWALDAVLGRVV